MSIALTPGSFDPVTRGHLAIIRRAATIFDTVIVAVAQNSSKGGTFSLSERISFLEDALHDLPSIQIKEVPRQLLVEFARDEKVDVIVKGLRGATDFDYELPMALANRQLSGIETIFLPAESHFSHLSSSLVREIARYHGDVSLFVTPFVEQALREKFVSPGISQ